MPPRNLTQFEVKVRREIVTLAEEHQREFVAVLETPEGPLIVQRTSGHVDRVDLTESELEAARLSGRAVVHHNHLSQESLSVDDWMGLIQFFSETFAHCADGTTYWGRVVDKAKVESTLQNIDKLEWDAANSLYRDIPYDWPPGLGTLFRKEVINRAMRLKGMVRYEYAWGSLSLPPSDVNVSLSFPVHEVGKHMDPIIDEAAEALARSFLESH